MPRARRNGSGGPGRARPIGRGGGPDEDRATPGTTAGQRVIPATAGITRTGHAHTIRRGLARAAEDAHDISARLKRCERQTGQARERDASVPGAKGLAQNAVCPTTGLQLQPCLS